MCPDVYLGDNSHDWLSPDDGVELRKLMPWVSIEKKMPERVHRALWNHELAMRTYYLDTRWTLVVAGLEALISSWENEDSRKKGSRWRFVCGVEELGIRFGIAFSPGELHDCWTLRSHLAHGQSFLYGLHEVLAPDKHRPLYDKLESLLRATVKECLIDEAFGKQLKYRHRRLPRRRVKGAHRNAGRKR